MRLSDAAAAASEPAPAVVRSWRSVSAAGAPARAGTPITNADGEEIGVVTSGSHSPMLKKGIGMCYVKPGYNKAGTELFVTLRKKTQTITITKMPFVPQNYYRGP